MWQFNSFGTFRFSATPQRGQHSVWELEILLQLITLETLISMTQSFKRLGHLIWSILFWFWTKVGLIEVDFSLPSVEFFNSEAGVGLMLNFEEDTENGVFALKFTFPEKWHPEVESYNRWPYVDVGSSCMGPGCQGCTKSDAFAGSGPILWERLRSTSSEVASSTLTSTSRFVS